MLRPFEFGAGAPSLNFVDTLAARETGPCELLGDPADVDTWFHSAGFDHQPQGRAAANELQQARELREAIYRCAAAITDGAKPAATDITIVNGFARRPAPIPQWAEGKVAMEAADFFAAAFAQIAADAIFLLSDERRARLRRCPDCRMLFYDSSRPGKRIWCSSVSGCGNRAKVRRHRARQSTSG